MEKICKDDLIFFWQFLIARFDKIKIHCTWWWWSSVPPRSDSGFIWLQTELTFSIITAALKRAPQETFKVTLNLELSQSRYLIIAIWSKAFPPLHKIPCSLAEPDMLFNPALHTSHWLEDQASLMTCQRSKPVSPLPPSIFCVTSGQHCGLQNTKENLI